MPWYDAIGWQRRLDADPAALRDWVSAAGGHVLGRMVVLPVALRQDPMNAKSLDWLTRAIGGHGFAFTLS